MAECLTAEETRTSNYGQSYREGVGKHHSQVCPLRGWNPQAGRSRYMIMQLKTDGRVVRLLTKRRAAEEPGIEQWFLVAIGDDAKAKEAISSAAHGTDDLVEIVGTIPATSLASLDLTEGEVRLVLPGEPINS
jgi:hypothetical protein